jgi:hypothetical protein
MYSVQIDSKLSNLIREFAVREYIKSVFHWTMIQELHIINLLSKLQIALKR